MSENIFKVFGKQTKETLLEIIAKCMDDYLFVYDLQNNTIELSESAVDRFMISENVMNDAANDVLQIVYEEDRKMLQEHLTAIYEGKEKVHNLHYRWLDKEGMPVRIIKKGPLFGITGKLMRYGSRHYVAIEMPQSTALLKVSYTWCEFVSE